MKKIKTIDSVGQVILHDITQIIPGEFKGRAFKKGHVIKKEDIEMLLSLGKDNIYVLEDIEGMVHENQGAIRLKELCCGNGLDFSEIKEGKIDMFAAYDGLLKVNKKELLKLNMLDEIMFSTIHNNTPVKKGDKVGGTRVIPLMIDEKKLEQAEKEVNKLIHVEKIRGKKVGIITTGNEVYYKRIEDAFGPAVIKKVEEYGCEVLGQVILPDNKEMIKNEIKNWYIKGAEMVVCTGGMSVDPDDLTPSAIRESGADVITYGSPVLPGAMFLLSYYENKPLLGLPGCVMYAKRTIFDLVLPRILVNEKLMKKDIAMYGEGGMCLNCNICIFPKCGFGK
ncbi:molybdopterin-binding protein [Clostridium frigidicarnis]|uniref:Molybdopterin molybdenumtransferase n=1 Tax=Clostridium frigidicarnis TaxID=84698 RepID=A0A1I0YFC4_9CLOT|nr:molybdopterin-binding protein [Clostridium frigidicarnis]SFB12115.1 molybdenum cofactor synthesis domain-containing protein [Clostridium frigidicarnis]